MFVIDDLLLSPVKGFMWIVRELHKAAEDQIASESEDLTARLSTLYMMLETGQIDQAQFDEQERAILDRLDAIDAAGDGGEDDDDGDSIDGDDDEDGGEEADEGEDEDGSDRQQDAQP
jgi:hypothetical protein